MKQVRLGIIGIGNMGTAHARNILEGKCPEIALAAVTDMSEARRAWAKDNLPAEVAVFDTVEDMLDSGRIDAALIASPHYLHPVHATACFARHIHALVEKPAAVSAARARAMNEAAQKSGVVFGIMLNQRANRVYQTMRQVVKSGELGAIRRTNWVATNWYRPQAYFDSGAWRGTWSGEGGGVLLNQCPHNLDLWQWICGMPVRLRAQLGFGKWHDIEVEDDATVVATYENGATGVFVASTGDMPGSDRFEITLDGGKLVAENGQLTLWRLSQTLQTFEKENTAPFGSPPYERTVLAQEDDSDQHVAVLNAFAGAILRGEPLVARGEEGLLALTLSNAMYLSAWQNREVALPLDEAQFEQELALRAQTSRPKQKGSDVTADVRASYGKQKNQ